MSFWVRARRREEGGEVPVQEVNRSGGHVTKGGDVRWSVTTVPAALGDHGRRDHAVFCRWGGGGEGTCATGLQTTPEHTYRER